MLFRVLIDFIALALLYFFVFCKNWRQKGRDKLLVNTIMYIYLAFVLYFTLMPIITSLPLLFDHPYRPMNLEPFIDITFNRGDCIRQVVLNIIMTIPFGFQFPLISRKKPSFLQTVFFTFLLSLSIEVIQPLFNGFADITDLITNTLGGAIGYLFYLIFRPLTAKVLSFVKDKPAPTDNLSSTPAEE